MTKTPSTTRELIAQRPGTHTVATMAIAVAVSVERHPPHHSLKYGPIGTIIYRLSIFPKTPAETPQDDASMIAITRAWIARRRKWLPKLLLGWTLVFLLASEYYHAPSTRPSLPESILQAGAPLEPHIPLNHTEMTSKSLPTVTIFYHLYVPKEEKGTRKALGIITQQLRHLSEALAAIPGLPPLVLYYTSVGADMDEVDNTIQQEICQKYSRQFQSCHRLQHLDQGFEEHTLQALYQHCLQHNHDATDRVIYIHSKGSYHSSKGQNHWRRHMTDAVASRDCIEQPQKYDCDLCGLLFVARPSHHFTGNMFNAKCSHIRRLIPPMEFERKMNDVYKQAQKLIQEGRLEANLFRLEEPWNSGTQRYAMEHWHGSHPSVNNICDLSNHSSNKYWKSIRAQDRKPGVDWQLETFPRRPQPGLPSDVANDESKRKREYFLLAGQLMKWYQLYGEAPSEDSWVWSWYPDGPFWKEQVRKHGSKAVEVVTSSQWRNRHG